MRGLVVLVLATACGNSATSQRCERAVDHILSLATVGEVSDQERSLIKMVRGATLDRCRSEGLSEEQASCLMAARGIDWDERLRGCPAFAAKPPSWVIVRPTRAERIKLTGKTPTPDGPREGPVSYRSLTGTHDTTCGLDDAGAIQCWGQPLATPPGTFEQVVADGAFVCGLDSAGLVRCVANTGLPVDRVPTEPLTDFDLGDNQGCGLRKADGSIACWNHLDGTGVEPPFGQFTDLVFVRGTACALRLDERVACNGEEAPPVPRDARFRAIAAAGWALCAIRIDGTLACFDHKPTEVANVPAGTFQALACERDHCCAIKDDQTLACWGAKHAIPDPPAGTFTRVAMFVGRACAVRASGGTICWGDNDAGACNVPQRR